MNLRRFTEDLKTRQDKKAESFSLPLPTYLVLNELCHIGCHVTVTLKEMEVEAVKVLFPLQLG